MSPRDGGYDEGYRAVPCFWGAQPGSLVASFLASRSNGLGSRVLDLGCGEGKNAAAFSAAGYNVDAIDCSQAAIKNGKKAFANSRINWIEADASEMNLGSDTYDVVLAYGLFHCLKDEIEIDELIEKLKRATKRGGHHIICTFNDRSHDLSAHPGFRPTLVKHQWYLQKYREWSIESASDSDLFESHPHNEIEHHHSLTRLVAWRLL